jgi:hypothetical protein
MTKLLLRLSGRGTQGHDLAEWDRRRGGKVVGGCAIVAERVLTEQRRQRG